MKYFPLLILLLFFTINTFAQAQQDKSHYLKTPTVVTPIDITQLYTKEGFLNGNKQLLDTVQTTQEQKITLSGSLTAQVQQTVVTDTVFNYPITIESGYAYNIIQEVGTFTIIQFWTIKEQAPSLVQSLKLHWERDSNQSLQLSNLDTLKHSKINGLRVENKSGKTIFDLSKGYYLVKTSTLKNNSTDFENKQGVWNIGILVLPVKIRPFATERGQFDFADGFSVGTTVAFTLHHNWRTDFTHNLLLYVGIGSYTADSSKLKEKRDDYKIATFSPAVGYMWERNNVQLSFLTGIDFPAGEVQRKWVYKNKPWLGIGVGIGLFKINNDSNTATQSNQGK